MKKANLLIDCQDHLGEGVLWSKTDQKLDKNTISL